MKSARPSFSTQHPFHELAWSAFYFHTVYEEDKGQDYYIRISNDPALLNRLRNKPTSPGLHNDLVKEVLPFLNQWHCRIPEDEYDSIAKGIIALLNNRTNQRHFQLLRSFSAVTANLSSEVCTAIKHLFNAFVSIKHVGPTAASKLLHLFHPHVVMWDQAIAEELGIRQTPDGYIEYHVKAQTDATAVIRDFQNTHKEYSGTLEDFLFHNLSLDTQKTLAKFLDEHYWITFTEQIDIPPSWHPDK